MRRDKGLYVGFDKRIYQVVPVTQTSSFLCRAVMLQQRAGTGCSPCKAVQSADLHCERLSMEAFVLDWVRDSPFKLGVVAMVA